jgi:protein gp37
MTLSVRLSNMGQSDYDGSTNGDLRNPQWSGSINCNYDRLAKNFASIRNARGYRRTFYGSMTDLWHESLAVDGPELTALAREVESLRDGCRSEQVVMFLTKRTDKMLSWQRHHFPEGLPEQIWMGCTVENQKYADKRIPLLTQVKAKVRYLSSEPMVGHVRLKNSWLGNLEWIIVGGESGHKARPGNPAWYRSLRDQANSARIAFHFKQWGEHDGNGIRIGKKKAGRHLDGRTWDEIPGQWPFNSGFAQLRLPKACPGGKAEDYAFEEWAFNL